MYGIFDSYGESTYYEALEPALARLDGLIDRIKDILEGPVRAVIEQLPKLPREI